MARWHLPVLFAAVLTAAACMPYKSPYGDSGPTPPDADADTDTDSDTDADTDADADADTDPGPPQLDSGHPGWKQPACLSCHTPDDHNTGMDPYQCAGCHGTNGAPAGHGGTPPCGNCHGQPHGASGFPDPDSCQTCHPG